MQTQTCQLTHLLCFQVEDLLPISAPAWPRLRELSLRDLCLHTFPAELASALNRLTYLDLANNRFARLPVAIKALSNLQQLELPCNAPLQLAIEDAATLAALPHLLTLNISKLCEDAERGTGWTDSSVVAFLAISESLPLLKLAVTEAQMLGELH